MTSFLRASVAVAGASLFLAACSSPPTWEKAGANETTVANDSNDCRVQARFAPLPERYVASPDPSVTSKVMSREDQRVAFESAEFQKCMTGKGYTAAKR
ncbi:MAG TPA: hypothetical protein VKE95_14020 [Burkholderiales bacterium]|nr:hypothetical protein [Burkholderiales bacterium]